MQKLPSDSILKFNKNTLNDVRKMFNLEKGDSMNKTIDILSDWIQKQNHFNRKQFDRDFLERLIIRCKGSVERSKERLEKMCSFRTLWPHLIPDHRDEEDFSSFEGIYVQALLPTMTPDHQRVYLLRNAVKKLSDKFVLEYVKHTLMLMTHTMYYDYSSGFVFIFDWREFNIMESVPLLSKDVIRQLIAYVTDGFGGRIKSIHILSSSTIIDMATSLMKTVFKEKIGERIQVHRNIDSLHQFVPKNILPKEYGGQEMSLDKLYNEWQHELSTKEYKECLKDIGGASTDESKRQKDSFNTDYIGMPGTFRSLVVD